MIFSQRKNFILCLSMIDMLLFHLTIQNCTRNRTVIFQYCLTAGEETGIRLEVHFSHLQDDMTDRQAHHAGETAVHARHGMEPGMLDRICPGLVERIAAGHIGLDLLIGVMRASAHRSRIDR